MVQEIIIGWRVIAVSHVETEATEYGDIQRYRIDVSGSDAVIHLSSLRWFAQHRCACHSVGYR
ncbi:hypothetical protein, partial [Microbacterium aurum]